MGQEQRGAEQGRRPRRAGTVGVDFDGVLHAYRRGWDDGSIYDEPVPGAVESLRSLMERHAVFIHTSREPEQVMPWLEGRRSVRRWRWPAASCRLRPDRSVPFDHRGRSEQAHA
ncbi:hypothetical protein [Sphaerisporangium perillae]|uniref:hypothetical protein n=1 Tax=Sphaerisporangium perillae TaxID=2935860 RepID=UPI00200C3182|nr:hypothetical protein [Sphaerisporangium perillae]